MGITLIMWKKSPLDRKIYPPEKILSFICFTEHHPPQKALFKIKVSSKTCWRLCVQIKFVLMNHIVTKEQNKLLYCIHMYEHWCEYKKFLRLDIWDARFTIQGLWELISNHFTTKNTIYSHSFFSRVFKNAATTNL